MKKKDEWDEDKTRQWGRLTGMSLLNIPLFDRLKPMEFLTRAPVAEAFERVCREGR